MANPDLLHVTAGEFSLPKINQGTSSEMAQSAPNVNTFTKKHVATKTFNKDDAKLMKTYDMKLKKAEVS